ncbi:MAG: GAF domain-containing protein [Acidobacteriota bacterium]
MARLGQLALSGASLASLMNEATTIVAQVLRVEYSKVLELLPDGKSLLLRAGVGWKRGCVGRARVAAKTDSQAGFTLLSKHPVVTEDLRKEERFTSPALLSEHNVVSGISVIILGRERPFGILGAHSSRKRAYSKDDVNFMRAIANVLATAIERRQAEDTLKRQAQVLDQIHDSVVSTDLDGIVTSWNKGAKRLFGYTAAESLGRHISFVYPKGQRKFIEQQTIRPLKEKGSLEVEAQRRKKSGKEFWAHVSLSLLRDSRNAVVGMIGYSIDVSKRRQAEERLRAANKTLQREIAERKQAERVARSHTQVLLHTLDALTTAPDLAKFLDEVLIAITDEIKVHSCALWFHDFPNKINTLYKTSYSGRILMGERQLEHPSASESGIFKRKIALKSLARRPFVINNATTSRLLEPEVRAWMKAHGVKLVLCVPLLFGKKVIGTLTVRDARRDRFSRQEIILAQALARHVSLALQLIRLAEEGQHAALLQERNRVAREMHDTLGQSFTGILIQLEAAEDILMENPQVAGGHLKKARDLARESLAEARRSVWALRPRVLEDRDLASALRNLAQQMTVGKQIRVDFSMRGTVRPLSPETEVHLLRIGQEALTNALRHAQASRIRIELAFSRRGVQLSVQDNGQGFNVPSSSMDGGFGQVSLRERAEQIGARITVNSEPGSGTRVVAVVPVTSSPAGVLY